MPHTQVPGSVLLCIIFQSDIATLKHLRLVCRNFNALTEAYGKSIHAKALATAYTQDLVDGFDVRWREQNPLKALVIADGRIQEARWMAAVRLRAGSIEQLHEWEDQVPPNRHEIPTGDIMSVMNLIVLGVGIMWRLHDCAIQEMCLDFGHDALHSAAYVSDITIDYPQLEDLEHRILRKQISLVENLPLDHRDSLWHALGFCVRVLYHRRAFTPESDALERGFELRKDSWIKWLALREGPAFIAAAWRSEDIKQVHTGLIERSFTNRNPAQMDIEMDAVELLYEAVRQEGIIPGKGLCQSPHGSRTMWASKSEIAELEHLSAGKIDKGISWRFALGREAIRFGTTIQGGRGMIQYRVVSW